MANPADNRDLVQRSNLNPTVGIDDQPIDQDVTPGLVGHVDDPDSQE
jgi:hypothetical protein